MTVGSILSSSGGGLDGGGTQAAGWGGMKQAGDWRTAGEQGLDEGARKQEVVSS